MLVAPDHKVRTTSAVTLAENVDLQTAAAAAASGAPGSTVDTKPTVHNGGKTTSRGAVLVAQADHLVQYAGNFSNCETIDYVGAICTFDEELEPGKSYRLSAALPFKLDKDVRTGAVLQAFSDWWTKDDWDLVNRSFPDDGTPGTGAKLRLVVDPSAKPAAPQTDPDRTNSFTQIAVKVTGNQHADLSVKGATASGKKGDVVQVSPSYTNLGPAVLEYQPGPVFRVTIPQGTTAVDVSGDCQPYTSDEEWDQWGDKWGEPGAREYGCVAGQTPKGVEYGYEFGLRIDKVVAGASGAVAVRLGGDPNGANDTAKIVINPADAGGGGGGDLPVTGASAGLIAGLGGLLLAAGIGGYLLAKRRRTRFVS